MSVSFVVLTAAAVALVAVATSAVVGAALALGRRSLGRLRPDARVRLVLAAALAPLVASVSSVAVSVTPWLGGVADHCSGHGHHPHLCPSHAFLDGSLVPVLLAALAGCATIAALGRAASMAWLSFCARLRLHAGSSVLAPHVRVIEHDEPIGCVAGLVQPEVFVSRGLLSSASRASLDVVLAHERSHARRRDPLLRWLASFGLAFHLPGVARFVESALIAAQEATADRDAAATVGDPARVAEAIVELARIRLARAPRGAVSSFVDADLEQRVHELLDDRARTDVPRWSVGLALGLAAALLVAGASDVHHGLETLLSWLAA